MASAISPRETPIMMFLNVYLSRNSKDPFKKKKQRGCGKDQALDYNPWWQHMTTERQSKVQSIKDTPGTLFISPLQAMGTSEQSSSFGGCHRQKARRKRNGWWWWEICYWQGEKCWEVRRSSSYYQVSSLKIIHKQLFLSGSVNIGEYSWRRYSPTFTSPSANNC